MATVDPIVQCAACGAKLRLRAASLKVLKQVRCGKCQSMIEIPDILKGECPFPEGPILAKMPATGEVTASAHEAAPSSPAVAPPKPVPVPAPAVVERLEGASAAAVPPVPRAEPRPAPEPPPPASPSPGSRTPVASTSYDLPRSSDSELVARLDSLELILRAQQESISLLTAQLRQIVKAQATAATTAQAILDR